MASLDSFVGNSGSGSGSGSGSSLDSFVGGGSAQPAQQPQQSLSDQIWAGLSGAGSEIAGAFSGGVNQVKQGYQQAQQATNPIQQTEAGLQMGAGAVNAVGSFTAPITAPIGQAVNAAANKLSDIPAVQSFAQSGAGQMTSRVAQDVNNTATLLPVAAGVLSPKEVGSTINGVKQGAKAVSENISTRAKASQAVGAAKAADKSLSTSIQQTMPFQDKSVRIDELRNTLPDSAPGTGGVARQGILGKSTPQPTAQDIQRGTIAHEYINGVKDPVSRIGLVNKGIQDTSTKVDSFLDQNAAPANFADMRAYMEKNKPSASLQKDPGASEAYQRATDGALNTLYDTMKKSAKESGDFGAQTSGKDIRAARIAVDQQITKELGENAFGTPQYRGIKAAEIDSRNLMNRMSEDMLRYPGQMESLNKMNDFISQAKSRGVEIDMKNPAQRASIESSFGLKPTGEAQAAELASQHERMSHLYDARDNMIDNYQARLGKNHIQEAIANSPVAKAGVGVVKRVIPFGIGTHL